MCDKENHQNCRCLTSCKDRKPTVLLENYNHLNKLYNSNVSIDQYHIIVMFYYVGKQDYLTLKYVQDVTLNSA